MSTNRENLMRDLSKAVQRMSRPSLFMRSLIAEHAGLNVTDAECIDYLMELHQASAKDLAQAMHLSKSTITSMLDRLERTSYITREADQNDHRRVVVRPNMDLIRARLRPFYLAHGAEFQKIAEQYTETELHLLTSHYKRMTDLYVREIERLLGNKETI